MPHPRLHITELDLILRPSLHPHIVPQNTNRSAQRHLHCWLYDTRRGERPLIRVVR
jgi:hypothetical protein